MGEINKVGFKRTYCKKCNELRYMVDDHTDTCSKCLSEANKEK